jgi:hypothetical protein
MDSTIANAVCEIENVVSEVENPNVGVTKVGGAVPDTRIAEIAATITAGIKTKPTSVPEALTLLEHLALKHIEPLIDYIRSWALSEVEDGERKLAEMAIKAVESQSVKKD